MMEWVAMLRPREVPVAESGTRLVMALLAIVLRRAPAIIIGTRTIHSRGRLTAIDYTHTKTHNSGRLRLQHTHKHTQ